jgi:YggT family protein
MAPDCLVKCRRADGRKRLTIAAIYNPHLGQVKNGEIAVFPLFSPGLPLFAHDGTDIYGKFNPAADLASSPDMRAILDIVLIVLDLYVWLLIASAILSWLIAFNVVNTRNQFVAAVAEFLYRITEPVLAPIRRMMPNLGGLDISPIILILIIMFIQRVIQYYIYPSVF